MAGKLSVIAQRRMALTFFLGYASGLPLLATSTALQAWMSDLKIDLSRIGLIALVGLPYTLKFLWAPIMDRFIPPFLGRRRGWMLVTQLAVMAALAALGLVDPARSPWLTAFCAVLVCFFSASQDIVLDAHRRDTLRDEELGLGSSLFVTGYRFGMLTSGAGALWLSTHFAWSTVYLIIAACMGVGLAATLLAPEPEIKEPPRNFVQAVWDPLVDFFRRARALEALAFLLLFKLGHAMAYSLLTPYVLDVGYSKESLAAIGKTVEMVSSIGGGLLGGVIVLKLGIGRSLWVLGVLQAASILGFPILNHYPRAIWLLGGVLGFESVIGAMSTSAFVAYAASLTNRRYSATQYAALTSLISVPRTLISAYTGYMAKYLGWDLFFWSCTVISVPGMLLLLRAAPWRADAAVTPGTPAPNAAPEPGEKPAA